MEPIYLILKGFFNLHKGDRVRFIFLTAVGLVTASFASAETIDGRLTSIVVSEHIEQMSVLSEAKCRAEEQIFRDAYSGTEERVGKVTSLFAEGTRLLCEATRIKLEGVRLNAEQLRLRAEAERLETAWMEAHEANPEKFPNYSGRDASQQALLDDAETLQQTVSVFENIHENLIAEARRILTLGQDDFRTLNDRQTNIIIASFDSVDEYEVLLRLIGKAKA